MDGETRCHSIAGLRLVSVEMVPPLTASSGASYSDATQQLSEKGERMGTFEAGSAEDSQRTYEVLYSAPYVLTLVKAVRTAAEYGIRKITVAQVPGSLNGP